MHGSERYQPQFFRFHSQSFLALQQITPYSLSDLGALCAFAGEESSDSFSRQACPEQSRRDAKLAKAVLVISTSGKNLS
jgi:hypothetical protein